MRKARSLIVREYRLLGLGARQALVQSLSRRVVDLSYDALYVADVLGSEVDARGG
ncbi:hypothetical protein GCM10017687_26470 [Streptomyces echinatus]